MTKKVCFYISDETNSVDPDSDLWNTNLPTDKEYSRDEKGSAITIGDYFSAAEIFFTRNDYSTIKSVVKKIAKQEIRTIDIGKIEIFLVKHGQFYHPAKVRLNALDETFLCVLNLAVSEDGIACLEREYPVLEKLCVINSDIPAVYEKGEVSLTDSTAFSMFAAEWFEGYKEFHVSYDNEVKKIVVWDYENGFYYLDEQEIYTLYKKAAVIMTRCYNVETFEQIQPWHHAAGDFVVRRDSGGVDVKLITVRQYTSLFENTFDDAESILEATLIFLIGLTIRMRLDRVDGVKESVWADEVVLKAVLDGFFEAMEMFETPDIFESDFAAHFKNFIKNVEMETINEFSMMIAGSYHPESSDYSLVDENISEHVKVFYNEIKKWC